MKIEGFAAQLNRADGRYYPAEAYVAQPNSAGYKNRQPTIALRKQAHGGVGKICTFDGLCESRGKWFINDACLRKARALSDMLREQNNEQNSGIMDYELR